MVVLGGGAVSYERCTPVTPTPKTQVDTVWLARCGVVVGPESSLDCLTCVIFAQQRHGVMRLVCARWRGALFLMGEVPLQVDTVWLARCGRNASVAVTVLNMPESGRDCLIGAIIWL